MFELLNIIGLLSFAFSGGVKGLTKNFDLFGITLLGIITALGGGTLRDILVLKTPQMLTNLNYVIFALIGAGIAIGFRKKYHTEITKEKIFLISDAIGLAAFTVGGCLVAVENKCGFIGFVILGLSTAVGGGIIRDILAGETPLVLKEEFYASCAIAGSILFWLLWKLNFTSVEQTGSIVVFIVFFLRLIAIKLNWKLPRLSID